MMKKCLIFIILQYSFFVVMAQCAFEKEYSKGNRYEKFKVIEGKNSSSYSFYGASIDSTDPKGQVNSQIWIIKHDSCGSLLLQKNFGYNEFNLDDFRDVIYAPDSALLILGYGESLVAGSIFNITLFKLDLELNIIWKKVYTGKNSSFPNSISYNPITNSYFIAGYIERKLNGIQNRPFILEVDTAGNVIREKDLIINNDSTSLGNSVYGVFPLLDSTLLALVILKDEENIYLIKLDRQLNILWEKRPFLKDYQGVRFFNRFVFHYEKNRLALIQRATPKDSLNNEYIYLFEIDTSGEIVTRINIEKDRPPGGTLTISLSNDRGYIIGYPFLKLNRNLEVEWQKFLSDSITLHSVIQMHNGSYVLLGEKYHEDAQGNGYEKLYIQQTDRRGWMVNTPEKTNNKEQARISLYPNPSSGIFTLSNTTNQVYTATITNTLGNKIQIPLNQNQLDLSHEPAGVYWVTLNNAEGEMKLTQKVVIVY